MVVIVMPDWYIKAEKQLEIEELTKKMNEKNKLENEKEKSELTLETKKDLLNSSQREIKNLNEQIKNAGSFNFNEQDVELTKNRIKPQEQILKELNVPATIFVTTGNFSGNKWPAAKG